MTTKETSNTQGKGEIYMVETIATGSDSGTSKNPNFLYSIAFRRKFSKAIHELGDKGGQFQRYTVVIQGDNTGPHTNKTFMTGVTDIIVDDSDGTGSHKHPRCLI